MALMLGLQIVAPGDGELKRRSRFLQYVNRLRVSQADELAVYHTLQRGNRGWIDALGEEFHVFAAAFEHVAENSLQKRLGEVHVVLQLIEGHFRFDHPELSKVARRVGVLRAKRRTERVHLANRAGE